MIVYTDERGCIKAVGSTDNPELIAIASGASVYNH